MGGSQSEYEPSPRRAGTDGLLEPTDVERYLYKQRLVKLTNNLKHNANAFRSEGNRFRWLYFLSVLFPSVVLSGSICVLAAWSDFSHKNTVIMILAILNAFLAMLAAFWDWQGASQKHGCSSKAFEHLLTRATQMKIECEQRPEKVNENDLDMLNLLYSEMGHLYEEAPNLPSWTLGSLQRQIEREEEKKLRQVDDEERREGGIGRSRGPSEVHVSRTPSARSLQITSNGSGFPPMPQDMIQKQYQQQYQVPSGNGQFGMPYSPQQPYSYTDSTEMGDSPLMNPLAASVPPGPPSAGQGMGPGKSQKR